MRVIVVGESLGLHQGLVGAAEQPVKYNSVGPTP